MMLAGAGESLLSSSAIWNIDVLGALNVEPDEVRKASCPFSLDRNGFVLSEEGAMLCLERLDTALARGATIYFEIQGYGNYSDAYDFTAPAPDGKARVLTLQHMRWIRQVSVLMRLIILMHTEHPRSSTISMKRKR